MKRGRKSLSALMTPGANINASRIVAPSTLSAREKRLFAEIVNACSPDHFRNSDIPVLVNFVAATLLTQSTRNKPKQFAVFEKAARLQVSLATKLRLTPSARTHPDKLARQTPQQPIGTVMPWNDDGDEDNEHAFN